MGDKSNQDQHTGLISQLHERPMIMGILNVTPDSFSDGGLYQEPGRATEHALRMIGEGADIIDIGGESSRPGAEPVAAETEMERVIPVIGAIRRLSAIPISVDTSKAAVAEAALEAGADWVNDVSGLRADSEMIAVVKRHRCPAVIMHMLGEPRTMQINPSYEDVVGEVIAFFKERISTLAGHDVRSLIIDPGIGFGKRLEDNLNLLAHLDRIVALDYPVMIGVSRKSFIGSITGGSAGDREAGTLAANIWGYQKGARIFRTHNVRPLKDALNIIKSISGNVNHR
jgi:dihydropteroate synthase